MDFFLLGSGLSFGFAAMIVSMPSFSSWRPLVGAFVGLGVVWALFYIRCAIKNR